MKIYLAARPSRRAEMELIGDKLDCLALDPNTRVWGAYGPTKPGDDPAEALRDVAEALNSDVLIALTDPPNGDKTGDVEFGMAVGMALALRKPVIVVGPPEHVFHTLPKVHQFDEWTDAIPDLLWKLYRANLVESNRRVRYGQVDEESPTAETPGEAIGQALADIPRDDWPGEIEIHEYEPRKFDIDSGWLLDKLLIGLDSEFGTWEEGPTTPTDKMRQATRTFAEAIIAEYRVNTYEPVGKAIYDVGSGRPD